MKRHEDLIPFSRDHHHALLCCWKIREGLRRGIPAERIKRFTDWFWTSHLAHHFDLEEQFVFPILGSGHHMVETAVAEHAILRDLFESEQSDPNILTRIATSLDLHIRYEERILFNAIQAVARPEEWAKLQDIHRHEDPVAEWPDPFWA